MFFKRLYRSFFPEHILYVKHRDKERVIHVKNFDRLSPKSIKGTTKRGEHFELVSTTPMDYYIIEFRDDLK